MRNSPHWSGSTRMSDDQESLADSKLLVNGVENLWFVEYGFMPYDIQYYRMATLIVVAPPPAVWWAVDSYFQQEVRQPSNAAIYYMNLYLMI